MQNNLLKRSELRCANKFGVFICKGIPREIMNCFCLLLLFLFSSQPAKADAKKILTVSDAAVEAETFDPQKQFSEKNHIACQQVFDGLIRFGPNCGFEPALAVSWERLDPLKMRFHLRKDVKFHNGEPFNADAVKFSLERYLDPKIGFPAIGFIESIDHVEIVDPYTVDIVTKYPDGLLLNRIAGFILISPPQYIKEKGDDFFAKHPIGTGAFILEKWEKDKKIVFSANPRYWMKGFPKLDGLVFVAIPPQERLKALFAGQVQLVTNLPGTQTRAVAECPTTKIIKRATFKTVSAFFNFSSGVFQDIRVRQALNYAVNKHELIRYDIMGNGIPITSISVRGECGYNPDLPPYEFDTKKASQLLAQAGYPNGFAIRVLAENATERASKILSAQFKNIGVKTDVSLLSDAKASLEFKKQPYDLSIAAVPNPMCHSYFVQSIALFSKSPYSLGNDSRFDEKLIDMTSTINEQARNTKAKDLDAYVYNNVWGIFLYQQLAILAADKKLVFEPYVTGMSYFFSACLEKNQ